MSYRVFLRAPPKSALKASEGQTFTWHTVRSRDEAISSQDVAAETSSVEAKDSTLDGDTRDWILPPASFEAASQRISEMYKNVIFLRDEDDEQNGDEYEEEREVIDETRNVNGAFFSLTILRVKLMVHVKLRRIPHLMAADEP